MAAVVQAVDLSHHHRAVDASSDRVDRHGPALVRRAALLAHLRADLPRARVVDASHRVLVEAAAGHHDVADLVTAGDGVVALLDDRAAGQVGRAVGLLEHLLVGGRELLVDGADAVVRDGLRDRAGDDLTRVLEGILGRHADALVVAEERLDHAVHTAKQDAALAEDIRAPLCVERRLEDVRRSHADGPGQRALGGVAGHILVHGERGVDA
mmetsp:Transcript_16163/g.41203  ORF Transcript_16163/g.41203 Transcript_16163/m.41203 type:complete len:211 (+) Transcript_16163:400-1032(+)